MTAAATAAQNNRVAEQRAPGLAYWLKNLLFGAVLCTNPVTAVIALGWLLRHMRTVSQRFVVAGDPERVNWVLGAPGSGFANRVAGGLWANLRTGVVGFLGLLLITLPFTSMWLLSWWAGWENSFNKGYEQSWAGPALGLTGVAVGLFAMIHAPMALAHQAAEARWLAMLEVRRVRQLVAAAGWRYLVLAIATVILALPLTGLRTLPVFIEGIVPGFADLPADSIADIAGALALVKAVYVFATLVFLRGWAARIYARAASRIAGGGNLGPWQTRDQLKGQRRRVLRAILRVPSSLLLLAVWFGLIAQIFVGQFLNHNWWYWLNHPYLFLPWLP